MMKESAEALRKVFDSIDKDKSGSIDRNEVAVLAKELGQEVKESDVEAIFSQMDTNKDGKISFEEFLIWWRNGAPSKMEKLVYLQLKGNKLLKKAHAGLTRLGATLETKYEDKDQTYIAVRCGDASDSQTMVHIHGGLCLKDETRRSAIVSSLGLGQDDYAIAVSFETAQAALLHEKLVELWETGKAILTEAVEESARVLEMLNIRIELKGDRVLIIVQGEKYAVEMYDFTIQQILLTVTSFASCDFSAKIDIKNTLKQVIEQDSKPYKLLTEGFLLEVMAEGNKAAGSAIRRSMIKRISTKAEKGGYIGDKLRMNLSLLMISSLKLVLNLTVPEVELILAQVSEVTGMNIGEQIPTANMLIDMAKGLAEGPVNEILSELPVGDAVKQILKNVDHTRTDLYVLAPKSYVHATCRIPGHKEILERIIP